MPSCGKLVGSLRITTWKTCVRLSTASWTRPHQGRNTVDRSSLFPFIIHVHPQPYPQCITHLLLEVPALFSPVSTAPITTHYEKNFKKGL